MISSIKKCEPWHKRRRYWKNARI